GSTSEAILDGMPHPPSRKRSSPSRWFRSSIQGSSNCARSWPTLIRADPTSTKTFGRGCSPWRACMGNRKYRLRRSAVGLAEGRLIGRSRACSTGSLLRCREEMKVTEIEARCREVLISLSAIIVGKNEVLRQLLAGILANGHILIEDYPGLAKTLIARLFGEALDLSFKRIQFTPDLLPGDITGSFLYDQRQAQFEFRHGPIFTQLLLADEINRATPKTQSALLEAMQEGQVTVEGESFPLELPFLVIATQNPIDLEGTYALPEAQLDRFIMRIAVGYPGRDEEREILSRRRRRRMEEAHVPKIITRNELLAMQAALEDVHVDRSIEEYIVDIVQATREDPRVARGASPRGSLALLRLARAEAVLRRSDFVTPDDVKAMAVPALAHRLLLRPELWVSRLVPSDVVQEILGRVPTPKAVVS